MCVDSVSGVALTVLVEAPIFVVCTLTGLGLFAFAVQLLHRLRQMYDSSRVFVLLVMAMLVILVCLVCLIRRLKMMLTSEQAIAALREGAAQKHFCSETFLLFSIRPSLRAPPSLPPSRSL